MNRASRRRVPAFLALGLAVALVAAGAFVLLGGASKPAPRTALDPFAAALSRGDDRAAARLTDNPAAALAALTVNRRGLDGAKVRAAVASVRESKDGKSAQAGLSLAWEVPGIGRFAYRSAATLHRKPDDSWAIAWSPKVVHPALDEASRLGTTREPARRGDILAADGRAIVKPRAVYRIGLARDKVTDIRASARALAGVVDVRASGLVRALRNAGPKQFVDAITLRGADYERVRDRLDAVPGMLAVQAEAPLAESRGFARALIGSVGAATADQLKALGDRRGPGDQVGQSGLQARYEERLGGTPTRAVVVRAGGVPVKTLLARQGSPGRDLRTTLDIGVQRAAETALGSDEAEAALVAVQPSTGNVLAVANRPELGYDRALEGRYPPGSTFKVITTDALLRAGLRPDETVDCPRTIAVGGRTFKNFEGGAAGAVPFAQDFAQSCNTAFVSLTDRLPASALGIAARSFGLGEPLKLGMPAAEAQVPPGSDLVARAATMIGQDRILASPLTMAGVAATVAEGRWRAPRLLASDPRRAVAPLASAELSTLRELTRRVVTSGTGTALAAVPGEVHGKSGTAEFGGGNPPETHAWFIAYRDDIAVAVLVEKGRSGGSVAAPIAARFFGAL